MGVIDLQNPFCLGPVRSVERFFGREKETRQALSLLHRRQNVSVEGPAKIGKTSFLLHVAHPRIRAQHGLAEEQVFVHLDSRLLADRDQAQCYLLISEEIIRQVKNAEWIDGAIGIELERTVRETGAETAYLTLRTLCQTAQDNDLKLIMLLDDFELLAHRFRLEHRFFSALRALYTSYQIAYLIASQSPLHTLERALPEVSPLFNTFHRITLKPLTPEEGHELVVTLLEQAGVEFPQFAIDCILELGSNEPYRLQEAGHVTFQAWQENEGYLQTKHCEEIRKQFGGEHNTKRV